MTQSAAIQFPYGGSRILAYSNIFRVLSVLCGSGFVLPLTLPLLFNFGTFGNLSRLAVDYGNFGTLAIS